MAEHVREQILEAVAGLLTGLSDVSTNVYRLRAWPQEGANLPSVNIVQGNDEATPDDESNAIYSYMDHAFEAGIEIRVQATGNIDRACNRIAHEITETLMDDITQGVTGCYHTQELGTSEPEISTEGKQPVALVLMTWQFRYRVTRDDPSATST